ncbi:MAG: hypothetical protein RR060_03010, partial [Victivallaceae bacterium]
MMESVLTASGNITHSQDFWQSLSFSTSNIKIGAAEFIFELAITSAAAPKPQTKIFYNYNIFLGSC